jgi:NAD(P)-dependent dehydrogenase (short-subunit alcohol dehydrogenase family)
MAETSRQGLDGARVLIVGGSAGIGQEAGLAAARTGASVVFSARRVERLEAIAGQAEEAHAVQLDVRDDASIAAGVAEAVERLGGLDAVLHAAGTGRMATLADETVDGWRHVLETNVIGAALVAKAVVPHLEAAGSGVMLFCSSDSDEQPRWGLSSYSVSKAALNRLVAGLRAEHPNVRFVRTSIGSTIGTEFGNNFDGEMLNEAFAHWLVSAQHTAKLMTADELGAVLAELIGMLLRHPDVDMPSISLVPPGGPMTLPPTPEMAAKVFEAVSADL